MLGIRFGEETAGLGMNISTSSGGREVDYSPKTPSRSVLGMTYGPLALFAFVSNPMSGTDAETYGESRASDWQLRFYGRRATWDVFYQDYAGFYNSTSADDVPTTPRGTFIKRPDIHLRQYGVHVLLPADPDKFSMGAAYDFDGQQLTSGGSLLLSLGISQASIAADQRLIPSAQAGSYGGFANFDGGEFTSVMGGPGYGYTWILGNHWMLGLVGVLNASEIMGHYGLADGVHDDANYSLVPEFKTSLGYSGNRYFGGVSAHISENAANIAGAHIQMDREDVMIFVGMKFNDVSIPPIDRALQYL